MRLTHIELSRAGCGWRCEVWFRVRTARQQSEECHSAVGGSRWWALAWWRARREAKRAYNRLAATPQERRERGWA